MASNWVDFNVWLQHTPAGNYVHAWQQRNFDEAVADLFGFYALQVNCLSIDALRNSRISQRWHIDLNVQQTNKPADANTDSVLNTKLCPISFYAQPEALPFAQDQFDLIVMPHTLEACHQPHSALREAMRVLRPEGRLILTGFSSARILWGLKPKQPQLNLGAPIGYFRLRDWLHLLNFEVDDIRSGCYLPGFKHQKTFDRLAWVDKIAQNRFTFLGGIYFIVATKKVYGVRMMEPDWRKYRKKTVSMPVMNYDSKKTPAKRQNLNN